METLDTPQPYELKNYVSMKASRILNRSFDQGHATPVAVIERPSQGASSPRHLRQVKQRPCESW